MLAALIATHGIAPPPPPPVLFYSNQFIAASNIFACLTIGRQAAALTTNLPIRYQLSLSTSGQESILDQLNRFYYRVINYLSSDANVISASSNLYLSDQITAAIITAKTLTSVLATLPVAQESLPLLVRLQIELAVALANLQALGKPL